MYINMLLYKKKREKIIMFSKNILRHVFEGINECIEIAPMKICIIKSILYNLISVCHTLNLLNT